MTVEISGQIDPVEHQERLVINRKRELRAFRAAGYVAVAIVAFVLASVGLSNIHGN